jgi:hypothetical protein
VVEHLPSKCKALSSNPSTTKKKKRRRRRRRQTDSEYILERTLYLSGCKFLKLAFEEVKFLKKKICLMGALDPNHAR